MVRREILGLFAHPDDEVFCLGGTMAKYMANGGAGMVVSLTQGEAGQIRDVTTGSRHTLGAVRAGELAQAVQALGATDEACFDFGDGRLAHQPVGPMIDMAAEIIDRFVPDVVISFGPDGGTGHADHVVVSEVAAAAAAKSERRPGVLRAVFPHRSQLLVGLLVNWLSGLEHRFMGDEAFAHGLMLFADGSSMLGYAADRLEVRFFPAGTFIIEQGAPSGDLFLVLSGLVDIIREDDGVLTTKDTTGPGSFFGEDGIAKGQPRNAHVVAKNSVTCFVLSPHQPNAEMGEGRAGEGNGDGQALPQECIEVDVRDFVGQKIAALSCHRSQYAIDADMFPRSVLEGIFGVEYFAQVELD